MKGCSGRSRCHKATITEVDFTVIDPGSAGCVLADRLSLSGRHSALVLRS